MPEVLLPIDKVFTYIVTYVIPVIAIVVSLLSYRDSRKANKIQDRLNEVEEKLKRYELEKIEKEKIEATKACVEARIIKISKGSYKLKIWNSGKATAYNVNFKVPEECESMVFRDKVPYEFLETGKNFEEHFLVHFGTPDKFVVTTTWEDDKGESYSKEQIVTI